MGIKGSNLFICLLHTKHALVEMKTEEFGEIMDE
jgi:hypothetical protein